MTAKFEAPTKKQSQAIEAISNAVLIGALTQGYDGNIVFSAVAKILTHLLLAYPAVSFEEMMDGIGTAVKLNMTSYRDANGIKAN